MQTLADGSCDFGNFPDPELVAGSFVDAFLYRICEGRLKLVFNANKRDVLPTSLEADTDAFVLVANRVTTAKAGP